MPRGVKKTAPTTEGLAPAVAVLEATPPRKRAGKSVSAPRKQAAKVAVPAVATTIRDEVDESVDTGRAPAQYTVQMVALLDATTGGTLRAAVRHQRRLDPHRTQAVVLREVIAAGLRAISGKWDRTYGQLDASELDAEIRRARTRRYGTPSRRAE
jgi:hypothetical protein